MVVVAGAIGVLGLFATCRTHPIGILVVLAGVMPVVVGKAVVGDGGVGIDTCGGVGV